MTKSELVELLNTKKVVPLLDPKGKIESYIKEECCGDISILSGIYINDFEVYPLGEWESYSFIPFEQLSSYFADEAAPSIEELSIVEMTNPGYFTILKSIGEDIKLSLGQKDPQIRIEMMWEECPGCGGTGEVNYRYSEGKWGYFCGGSPRCCP